MNAQLKKKSRANMVSPGNVDCFACCFPGLMDFICFAARLKCYYEGGVGLQKTLTHAGHGGKRRYGMPMPGDSDSDDDDDDDDDDDVNGGDGGGDGGKGDDDGEDDEGGEGGMHEDSRQGEGDDNTRTFEGSDNSHEASSADSGSQADSGSSLAGDGQEASGREATEGVINAGSVTCELISSQSVGEPSRETVAHAELRGVGNVSGACKYTVREEFGIAVSSTAAKRRGLEANESGTRRAKSISLAQTNAGSRTKPTLTRTQSQGAILVSSVSAAISAAVQAVNTPGRDEEAEQNSICVPTE